jgi:hypothetical protein
MTQENTTRGVAFFYMSPYPKHIKRKNAAGTRKNTPRLAKTLLA